jgi:glycosyltransferase involved in cell wall biosynthesis
MNTDYCVLLCSRDGASYIAEQLESIAAQSVPPALVLLFDDGSSDGTLPMALRHRAGLPLRSVELRKSAPGAAGAFSALLRFARDEAPRIPYYFLCDQDDRWRTGKAERLLQLLAGASEAPALVHSELLCFGDPAFDGRRLHDKLGHWRLESSVDAPLTSVSFENVVVGASCAFNRALLEAAVPVPQAAFMHDWWLALVCVATGGTIRYTREVLTEYRVHARSTVGRSGTVASALRSRIRSLASDWRDPWLRTVLAQLDGLPLAASCLPCDRLGAPYAAGRVLASSPRVGARLRAWISLLRRRVWSVRAKDLYYKARLFTDVVLPGYRAREHG